MYESTYGWDCLLAYPNYNKPFHVYIDVSSYQMGAYIVQDDRGVAFWWCKLNDAQLKYTLDSKEHFSIVVVLTVGAVLHIHTNHLNITTNNNTLGHAIWWFNYIEQFNPYIHFIPGKDKIINNMLNWLDCIEASVLSIDK